MPAAKPVSSPMSSTPQLTLTAGTKLDNPREYRTVVGSLPYLSFTLPDIAYASHNLCSNLRMNIGVLLKEC